MPAADRADLRRAAAAAGVRREMLQLGPGVGAFAAGGAALYRAVGRRGPPWLLVGAAAILVVAWRTVSAIGDCGISRDEGP